MVEINDIRVFPVKSLGGYSVSQSIIETRGIRYDRNWMIIDADSRFLTQRQIPKMTTIKTAIHDNTLTLSHPDAADLHIQINMPMPEQSLFSVKVWNKVCLAKDEGEIASEWLTNVLGQWKNQPLKLVKYAEEFKHPSANTDETVSNTAFPDAFPYLIAFEESLTALNLQLKTSGHDPAVILQFRPNIIVSGLEAWAEYGIQTLTHAGSRYDFKICEPCERCRMININPDNGESNQSYEPFKTLSRLNASGDDITCFGQYALLSSGTGNKICVGDILN